MPAQAKSLEITERYRSNMIRLRNQGQREAGRMWRQVRPNDLDGTFPLGQLELTVSTLQREAARLSSAYLATFIASELGEPERPPALSVWDKTFNGNDLREGLRSAIVTAKMAIKDGTDPREATKASRKILVSDVGLFIDTAARESLRRGMEMDDRIVGYQRALKGTCGACSGSTSYEAFSENAPVVPLNVHPNCQCVAEPVVRGPDRPALNSDELNRQRESIHNMGRADYVPPVVNVDRFIVEDGFWDEATNTITTASRGKFAEQRATLFHELGHAVDDRIPWVGEDYYEIQAAINASKAVQAIPKAGFPEEYAKYILQAKEEWARAYGQWLAGKVGDRAALAEMRKLGVQHWDDADFKPIADAIERVFRRRGWLN